MQAVEAATAGLTHGMSREDAANTLRVRRYPASARACMALRLHAELEPLIEVGRGGGAAKYVLDMRARFGIVTQSALVSRLRLRLACTLLNYQKSRPLGAGRVPADPCLLHVQHAHSQSVPCCGSCTHTHAHMRESAHTHTTSQSQAHNHTQSHVFVQSEGLGRAMRSLDMPLMRVLAGMEAAGVALDLAVLGAQKLPLLKQLGRLMVRTAVALK